MTSVAPAPGASVLDALSLLAQVADELVVRSARDTHLAIADRVHRVTRRATFGVSAVPEVAHRGIASAVYAGLGAGLRATSVGLDRLAATGAGPRLEDHPRGRFVSSAVNGLIGDRLLQERPQLAIPLAVRVHPPRRRARPGAAGRGVPGGHRRPRGLPARALRERGGAGACTAPAWARPTARR